MPVSKKRKKTNKKKTLYNNRAKKATIKNILYRTDYTLVENYDIEESIETFENLLYHSKDIHKDITNISNILHKRLVIMTTLENIYGTFSSNGDNVENIVISYKSYTSLLRIVPFKHNDNTLIISEINYINHTGNKDCIQPLVPITYLADILDVDLVFPAYTTGDYQEEMFKTFGFIDSDYPAEIGQKIMLRKSRRILLDEIIKMDKKLDLSKYYPNEDNSSNIFLEKDDSYKLCEYKYSEDLDTNIVLIKHTSNDIYQMAQWIYDSSNIGLQEYLHRTALANVKMEKLHMEDTFNTIYPESKDFEQKKYDRLYRQLLINDSVDILFSLNNN